MSLCSQLNIITRTKPSDIIEPAQEVKKTEPVVAQEIEPVASQETERQILNFNGECKSCSVRDRHGQIFIVVDTSRKRNGCR